MGSGWIGMSEGSIGGGCEIGRVVAEDLRIAPGGSARSCWGRLQTNILALKKPALPILI